MHSGKNWSSMGTQGCGLGVRERERKDCGVEVSNLIGG